MVISLPCLIEQKNWASPEQTALGKDFPNPINGLIVCKNYMVLHTHQLHSKELVNPKQTALEALAIPEQTATGKESSNLFMAGSLPKTTRPT
ncbi:hypothetical protein Tco_0456328 [Tanacetum coccineum]